MLEVPEASISLSSPSPHLFRRLPLQPRWSEQQQVDGKQHTWTHTHTHSQLIHCIWTVYSAGRDPQCLLFFSFHWLEANAFHTCSLTWLERNVLGTHTPEHFTTQWKRQSKVPNEKMYYSVTAVHGRKNNSLSRTVCSLGGHMCKGSDSYFGYPRPTPIYLNLTSYIQGIQIRFREVKLL